MYSRRQLEARGEPINLQLPTKLNRRCGCGGGDSAPAPAAPDYTPVANASAEAARVGAEVGREQIAESRRQYDNNMAVAKPVVDAQLDIMRQTADQGRDYYEYMVSQQRPVEKALNADAMKAGSETAQQEAVDRAVADSNRGYTRALNQGFRQARRYGISPASVAGTGVQQAQFTAGAATGARDKEKALGYAKKLDVAGLYRGAPGASTGAYSVATNAGNSAVNNSIAPGGQLLTGMNQGAGTVMAGQQAALGGLGSVLNSQTSSYNASLNQQQQGGGIGSIVGQGIGMWASGGFKSPFAAGAAFAR